jgi:hypothetical protein
MNYFHVRYNSFPVLPATSACYEEWISTDDANSCNELKPILRSRNNADVTVTFCHQITLDDFTNKRQMPPALITKVQLDAKNLTLWNLDELGRVSRKLYNEGLKSDQTYRNINKPDPLL